MGWAYGIDDNGREIGYSVAATCDQDGCDAQIDRGLAYRCGELHCEADDTMPGCGGYFCGDHLYIACRTYVTGDDLLSLCRACAEQWPDPDDADIEETTAP